mmetsp:Transcript_25153/g.37068  ORF Transcript_25153/g.37068 Transcript_25153/m.37068 type:complete len:426 (-) Transcript_25153:402-1679(-)
MGCSLSIEFTTDDLIFGRSQESASLLYTLGMTKDTMDTLFTAFSDMDSNSTNTIRMDEFLNYFKIEMTSFNMFLFGLFGVQKGGYLNFLEYVIAIWNFLTVQKSLISTLVFYLYDRRKCGYIEAQEVIELMNAIHTKKSLRQRVLIHLQSNLQTSTDTYSQKKFIALAKSHPTMIIPVNELQGQLRRRIIGEHFWMALTATRANHSMYSEISSIAVLQKTVEEIRIKHLKTLRQVNAANSRKKHVTAKRKSTLLELLQKRIYTNPSRAGAYASGDFADLKEASAAKNSTTSESESSNIGVPELSEVLDLPRRRRRRKSLTMIAKPDLRHDVKTGLRKSSVFDRKVSIFNKSGVKIGSTSEGDDDEGKNTGKKKRKNKHKTSPEEKGGTLRGSKPLPEGWVEKRCADKEVYYHNEITQETTWKRPS